MLHTILQLIIVVIAALCAIIAAFHINIAAAPPAFIAALVIGAWLIRDEVRP